MVLVTPPLRDRHQRLLPFLPELPEIDAEPGRRPVASELWPLLTQAADDAGLVTSDALFRVSILNQQVASALTTAALPEDELKALWAPIVEAQATVEPGESPEREALGRSLAAFGRLLTADDIPPADLFGRERLLPALSRPLVRMLRNDVVLVGPEGVGKSTIVRELARRIASSDPSLPRVLQKAEVFELSAEFLSAGAASRSRLQRGIAELMKLLAQHRQIITLIDPLDPLLEGDPARDGAQRSFEGALLSLIAGPTPVLACVSPAGYHALKRRRGWRDVFDPVHVEEPDEDTVVALLASLEPQFREHYEGLDFEEPMLRAIARRSARAYPASSQPRRSIQLLDDVCAASLMAADGDPRMTLADLDAAIAHREGPAQVSSLTEASVLAELRRHIVGQDSVLEGIARAFAAGLGTWADPERPRAVFLFGGPTGVGKTETAVQLARILGGATPSLIRVDCNTLQGGGHDKQSVLWPLLGVPLGYMGHGEGGQLSAIARRPRSVVLFDEFEKADPAVGKLLLQILDTGVLRDNDGVDLDFTRSVIIFTTNLGVDYGVAKRLGFSGGASEPARPRVDLEDIRRQLVGMGYGHEFVGRIRDTFLFQGIERATAAEIIRRQLERLAARLADRGLSLGWSEALPARLAERFEPRFGVRRLIHDVEQRLAQEIGLAELSGELRQVTTLVVEAGDAGAEAASKRRGSELVLRV